MLKDCSCNAKAKQTGDMYVMPDGFEHPIYRCVECGKEKGPGYSNSIARRTGEHREFLGLYRRKRDG